MDSLNRTISNQYYFEGVIIDHVFQDKDYNFWFSSKGDGLLMVPSLHTRLFNKSSGLNDNNVTTAIKVNNDKIVCGTLNGTFYSIDKNKVGDGKNFHSRGIRKIINDKDGNIYTLCDDNVFKNGSSLIKPNYFTEALKSMTLGTREELIVGANHCVYRFYNNKMDIIYHKYVSRFYAVFEKKRGELWLGSEHGVYSLVNDSLIPFHHELKPFKGWIDDISKDKYGRILITTRDSGLAIVSG